MTVTWRDVARKDFEDVVQSKLLWGITAGFVGLLAFFLIVGYISGDAGDTSISQLLAVMGQFVIFFIPLIAAFAKIWPADTGRYNGTTSAVVKDGTLLTPLPNLLRRWRSIEQP